MKKIAIVNISNSKVRINKHTLHEINNSLKEFVFLDYTGSKGTCVKKFNRAYTDQSIDVIWFLTGGVETLENIDNINHQFCHTRSKIIIGSSDATHFFLKVQKKNNYLKLIYYDNLKSIISSINEYFLVTLLNNINSNTLILKNNAILNLNEIKIVGGHSVITSLFIQDRNISSSLRIIFYFEHHYNNDSISNFCYFLQVLKIQLKKYKINEVILGHSKIYKDKLQVSYYEQLALARKILVDVNIFEINKQVPISLY